ncbi:MAG: hypothetical protein PHY18_02105 [Dehalococcoidales bacterium]|nr:hypothetical protein [Dehalococcoidales bacterium]
MDFFGGEGGSSQWTLIIPLIVLIVFSIFMRRRKSENNPQDIVMSLISDLHSNQRIIEQLNTQMRPTKLKIGSWQRNMDKIGFLDEATRSNVTNFFRMAEDFNLQMDTAKRYKTTSYISGINTERMKEPLAKSREGLQEWLKVNMQQMGPGAGRQGCLPGMGGG